MGHSDPYTASRRSIAGTAGIEKTHKALPADERAVVDAVARRLADAVRARRGGRGFGPEAAKETLTTLATLLAACVPELVPTYELARIQELRLPAVVLERMKDEGDVDAVK